MFSTSCTLTLPSLLEPKGGRASLRVAKRTFIKSQTISAYEFHNFFKAVLFLQFQSYFNYKIDVETVFTMNFGRCRDRDSARLWIFEVVKTETQQDYAFIKLSRPRLNKTIEYLGCWHGGPLKLSKSYQDRDICESLAIHCHIIWKTSIWPTFFVRYTEIMTESTKTWKTNS